jgi:hypothetical protein
MKKPLSIPSFLKPFFWDTDVSKLDLQKHKKYIIERILEYGDIKEVRWLFSNFEKEDIVEVLKKSRRISVKTGNYFYIILKLNEPKENFECLKKPYTQKQYRF